jgi:hypothetical protein
MNIFDQIGPYLGPFLLLMGLIALIFFLLRKLALWYWRVNEMIMHLNEIAHLLRRAPWNQQGPEFQEWEKGQGDGTAETFFSPDRISRIPTNIGHGPPRRFVPVLILKHSGRVAESSSEDDEVGKSATRRRDG